MDNRAILIVDDDELIRHMLAELLVSYGYHCTSAANAFEARRILKEQPFPLILCDVNMPGESGLDLMRYLQRAYPDTAVVMVTGVDDPQIATSALELGAYGYIIKPFEFNEVLINITNALRRRRLEIENRLHQQHLEDIVRQRTSALQQAITRLEHAELEVRLSREETINRLAIAAEYRDHATAQHIQRMSHYCGLLARRAGLPEARCELIRIASPMHDIGKIGTPDQVLLKTEPFTHDDYTVIARHAEIGYRILVGSDSELLKVAATIAWTHHEKFDGSGYPRKLAGDAIPLEGRIAAIADAFDALSSPRHYKPAFETERVVTMMREKRAQYYDPDLLDIFFSAMNDVLAIQAQYLDSQEVTFQKP
jgi:putative two-component system response regulator